MIVLSGTNAASIEEWNQLPNIRQLTELFEQLSFHIHSVNDHLDSTNGKSPWHDDLLYGYAENKDLVGRFREVVNGKKELLSARPLDTQTHRAIWYACIALIAYDACGAVFEKPIKEIRALSNMGCVEASLLLPILEALEFAKGKVYIRPEVVYNSSCNN